MGDEVPRRDAVVILAVTALIVTLIVLFFAHTPGPAVGTSETEPATTLSSSGE